MRAATARALRRNARDAAQATAEALAPPIQAAIDNEHRTRQRVDALETFRDAVDMKVLARGFWGRLSWLLRGK